MFDKICLMLKKYMAEEMEITPQTSIYDIGMNSLDFASLLCDMEDEFDCDIDIENMTDVETIQDIMDAVEKIISDYQTA